jgi:CheY-like chemotaxis protein
MPQSILIVDDESSLVEILALLLNEEGMTVYTAGNGAEALAQQPRRTVDVIFSDVMMPVLDGHGLLRALRDEGDRTSMILVSAGSTPVCDGDATYCLSKPFDLDVVLDLVHSIVDARVT